jgi:hypothetical protein
MKNILMSLAMIMVCLQSGSYAADVNSGEFFKIYDASVSETDKWYINDHCFIRDANGLWHLFGITDREPLNPASNTINLAHATAMKLTQSPWARQPYALTADANAGEKQLWAPDIILHDGTYYMFYCAGSLKGNSKYRIHLATSKDLITWKRHPANPMVVDGYDARDPYILKMGDEWVMYYTATSTPRGGNHIVACCKSKDLIHWGQRSVVFTDPSVGTFGGPTESPQVIRRGEYYYLFIGPRDEKGCVDSYRNTTIFRSKDPFRWTMQDRVGQLTAHAVEVVRDVDGQWYVSHCGWAQGGVYLAKLNWNDGLDDADTSMPAPEGTQSPIVTSSEKKAMRIWTVDPLTKVFRDDEPVVSDEPVAEAAGGECATLQIVVRSDRKVEGLTASLEPLILENGIACKLSKTRVRFVGYVHVGYPVKNPPSDQLRKPPGEFPDVLLDDKTVNLEADSSQPIWISIDVPAKTRAGLYGGKVKISGMAGGKKETLEVPVAVKVYDVSIGKSRLWLTNWFYTNKYRTNASTDTNLAELEQYSAAYWELLRKYAQDMAQHRQNMVKLSPLELTEYSTGESGKFKFDFGRFDRAVGIFIEEGVIGRIEGSHLGRRINDKWENQFEAVICKIEEGKTIMAGCDPCSAQADEFYSQFLPALVQHLGQKGWLDIYVQHVADEPTIETAGSYISIAKLVRKYSPQLKIIEACHTKELEGFVDIWVPQMNFLSDKGNFEFYKKRQEAGDEVWFYTCMYPQGEFANRFIEQPLWKTRILHWINYHYGLTGYLHWGYNCWNSNPFKETAVYSGGLPGGDSWIVYPGIDGPVDSIRFEAMRDGAADYELLCMLGEFDSAAAKALTARHIQAIDKYGCDIKSFRQTRRELLEMLSKNKSEQVSLR